MVTHSLAKDAVFRALADGTRREILELLREGPMPAGEIASVFSVSRPAVSKHLGALREARLVTEERHGRNRVYSLNAAALRPLDAWVAPFREFWVSSLLRLKAHVEAAEHGSSSD